MIKILFIGDIVGKPGRKALAQVLPMWKEKYRSDVIIANTENLAHGKGVTPATLAEIDALDIDCFTGGNHSFKKGELTDQSFAQYSKLIRPANFAASLPGHGFYRFAKEGRQFLVINLCGQVFMENQFDGEISNPFHEVDRILASEIQKGDIIFVDFHAEATSEKKAMGLYLDGRVAAVCGTHTHVPTADAHILPKGTGYISDVGMVGTLDSILGVKPENALKKFLDPSVKFKNEMEEEGVCQVNGVLITLSTSSGQASDGLRVTSMEKLYEEITNI